MQIHRLIRDTECIRKMELLQIKNGVFSMVEGFVFTTNEHFYLLSCRHIDRIFFQASVHVRYFTLNCVFGISISVSIFFGISRYEYLNLLRIL